MKENSCPRLFFHLKFNWYLVRIIFDEKKNLWFSSFYSSFYLPTFPLLGFSRNNRQAQVLFRNQVREMLDVGIFFVSLRCQYSLWILINSHSDIYWPWLFINIWLLRRRSEYWKRRRILMKDRGKTGDRNIILNHIFIVFPRSLVFRFLLFSAAGTNIPSQRRVTKIWDGRKGKCQRRVIILYPHGLFEDSKEKGRETVNRPWIDRKNTNRDKLTSRTCFHGW